jgi:transcription elongation factor GreB
MSVLFFALCATNRSSSPVIETIVQVMKTKLITRAGYVLLQQELNKLWREDRPETTRKVSWAASLGDRSENADYQYNKKRLREIDRRVRYLRKILEELKIVDYGPQQEGKVFFGAWVSLNNDDNETLKFRIVGPEEIYGRNDFSSIDSPISRACLKKAVADEVIVKTPTGEKVWYVSDIQYEQ